jgi:hypothetical protein
MMTGTGYPPTQVRVLKGFGGLIPHTSALKQLKIYIIDVVHVYVASKLVALVVLLSWMAPLHCAAWHRPLELSLGRHPCAAPPMPRCSLCTSVIHGAVHSSLALVAIPVLRLPCTITLFPCAREETNVGCAATAMCFSGKLIVVTGSRPRPSLWTGVSARTGSWH